MTIETKFNIGDLVQGVFQRKGIIRYEPLVAFLITDITTNCCYTTSQIFYRCRAVIGTMHKSYKDGKPTYEIKDFLFGNNEKNTHETFREDELKVCDTELAAEIRNTEH